MLKTFLILYIIRIAILDVISIIRLLLNNNIYKIF